MSIDMNWVGIIGGAASVIGAIISCRQCWKAKKAKEATEATRDKIFQNIQYEEFASFQKDCGKFERFLHQASRGKDSQGKSEDYIEDELESFITKFNVEISKTSGNERIELQEQYDGLCSKRNTVDAGNRVAILALLDDVRKLSRCVADIQMKNKMSV